MGASENGLVVEGIYWTADDSALISRAVIREFCAMTPDVARGWLSALWLAKLQEVRKDDRAIKVGTEDQKAEAVDSGTPEPPTYAGRLWKFVGKLRKPMIHGILIPFVAAVVVAALVEMVSRHPEAGPSPATPALTPTTVPPRGGRAHTFPASAGHCQVNQPWSRLG